MIKIAPSKKELISLIVLFVIFIVNFYRYKSQSLTGQIVTGCVFFALVVFSINFIKRKKLGFIQISDSNLTVINLFNKSIPLSSINKVKDFAGDITILHTNGKITIPKFRLSKKDITLLIDNLKKYEK